MKRTMAPALLAVLFLSACADGDDGSLDPSGWQPGEGPPPSPTEEESESGPFVFNRYEDEDGYPEERPETYVATDFTSFSDMSWGEWSDDVAQGRGYIAGTWCLDLDCDQDPYRIHVELGDPVDIEGRTYFSTYALTDAGDMPEDIRQGMEAADEGRLTVPEDSGGGGTDPEPPSDPTSESASPQESESPTASPSDSASPTD